MGMDQNSYECMRQIPNKIQLNNNRCILYFITSFIIIIYLFLYFLIFQNISYQILLFFRSLGYFQGIYKLCIQRFQLVFNEDI